jgi:hypothetical protein
MVLKNVTKAATIENCIQDIAGYNISWVTSYDGQLKDFFNCCRQMPELKTNTPF